MAEQREKARHTSVPTGISGHLNVDVQVDTPAKTASGNVKLTKFQTIPNPLGLEPQPSSRDGSDKKEWELTRAVDAVQPKKKTLFQSWSSPMAASSDGVDMDSVDPDPDNLVNPELKSSMEKEQLLGMRNVFNTFDSDNDGIVVPQDIGTLLRKLGLVSSKKMVRVICEVVDINGDGEIDFGEFVSLMVQVKKLSSDDEMSETGDDDETLRAQPVRVKLSEEETAAFVLRQKAMTAFKQAVTIMAFQQMTGDADEMRDQVLKVLDTDPSLRTEWELQRLLMWLETSELDFIQYLPPTSESDVRVQVCRCLTTKRFIPGQEIVHIGDKGDCMFIVLNGQADVVEERPSDKAGMPPDMQVIVSLGVGKSFGELAIIGEDQGDRDRSATCVAGGRTPTVIGVLTRKDYRNFILKMRMDEMEPVVDMLLHHPITAGLQRGHLLKMALVLIPATFSRHDSIANESDIPEHVTFLTSGAADMTVARKNGAGAGASALIGSARKNSVKISTMTIGSAVEMVGDQIVLDEKTPFQFTLIATTACTGFKCSRNVAKRFLGKKSEARAGIVRKQEQLQSFIEARVAATKETESTMTSLFGKPGKAGGGGGNGKIAGTPRGGRSAAVTGRSQPRGSDFRQLGHYVPDQLDVVAAEQSQVLHRTQFLARHPRRENPLHTPNPRYVSTYRSTALSMAVAKENGDDGTFTAEPDPLVETSTSQVWREGDMPVKDWLDDPYAEPPTRNPMPDEMDGGAQEDQEPDPEPEPHYPQTYSFTHYPPRSVQSARGLMSHGHGQHRKHQAVPLTSAARLAARDKQLGSPRSIASVRSTLALDNMKGFGTAAENANSARARLEGNGGGLPQLYPRDRTMPLPALGPGSTKAGVMVPVVRPPMAPNPPPPRQLSGSVSSSRGRVVLSGIGVRSIGGGEPSSGESSASLTC